MVAGLRRERRAAAAGGEGTDLALSSSSVPLSLLPAGFCGDQSRLEWSKDGL